MVKIPPEETSSEVKNSSILEFPSFVDMVAMVIVFNSVIGGSSWVDLVWFAALTVRLHYLITTVQNDWWNKAANAPITFHRKL